MKNKVRFIYICIILLSAFFFIKCTEVYYPEIIEDNEALVVEGMITNEPGPYTIKLSMAKPLLFDSIEAKSFMVSKAKVNITEDVKTNYTLTETSPGIYKTPSNFKARVGSVYRLYIQTTDGTNYISTAEKMPAPQTVDTVRAFSTYHNYVNSSSEMINVKGADVRADIFSAHPQNIEVPSCRFSPVLTYQYSWSYRDIEIKDRQWIYNLWFSFGWKTFNMNTVENITPEKLPSANPVIKNHPLCFIPFEPESYSLAIPDPGIIMYLRLNQYTLNSSSYRFYTSASEQLSANGKLFDPISAQLYGNMRCQNSDTKIVLGLFEVSSVTRHAFLLEPGSRKNSVKVKYVNYVDIPANKTQKYRIWEGMSDPPQGDTTYIPIPYPDWWYHQ